MYFFLLAITNFLELFLYLLNFPIFYCLFLAEDLFQANLISLTLILCVLHYFLYNKALKFFYYIISLLLKIICI